MVTPSVSKKEGAMPDTNEEGQTAVDQRKRSEERSPEEEIEWKRSVTV